MIIFVSSTFTDTFHERNILHEELLPQLQEKAILEDVQLNFYDMRFGIKDESSLDHMTWTICKEAIQECFEESDGMFFLSLQGDKYGYCFLPKFIDQSTLESSVENQAISVESKSLVNEWYKLDSNSLPSPQYTLKELKAENQKHFYDEVLPTLIKGPLDSLSFQKLFSSSSRGDEDQDSLFVNRSVTEWETLFALSLDRERIFWMKRIFSRDSLRGLWALCDTSEDPSKQKKIEILKGKMLSFIPESQVLSSHDEIPFQLTGPAYLEGTKDSECRDYLERWKRSALSYISKELDRVISKKHNWKSAISAIYREIPADHIEEILHHQEMVQRKASHFYGREELVQRALTALDDHSEKKNISLAIIGRSGTGKTALMSKLYSILSNRSNEIASTPFLIRFCGTSRYSLHGINLMQSISIQILSIYEKFQELKKYLDDIIPSQSYKKALTAFHEILQKYPVTLFIDSLDQLSNLNEVRTNLQFLLKIPSLHSKSQIIVSSLPDDEEGLGYNYNCATRLKEAEIRSIEVGMISSQGSEEHRQLLTILLSKRSRTITEEQWTVVSSAIAQEPTILYINLATEIISSWKSFDRDVTIQPTVKGIIHQIFDQLERMFGHQLVSWAFAFITFSREGMNDTDMKDCLSLQDLVLKEVFQYSTINSFPIHVWLRLKSIIKNLIAEKEDHCVQWYHRQLWETSEERYKDLRKECHSILGDYFGNLISESLAKERNIRRQSLILSSPPLFWLADSKLNSRRIKEAHYHLLAIERYDELIVEMCSLEMVGAAASVGDGAHFVETLGKVSKILSSSSTTADSSTSKPKQDSLFSNPLKLFSSNNKKKPEEAPPQSKQESSAASSHLKNPELLQRLQHYLRYVRKQMLVISSDPKLFVPYTASEEPHVSIVRQDCEAVLQMLPPGSFSQPEKEILWSRTVSGREQFDQLLGDFRGHQGDVTRVLWHPSDPSKIISTALDGTIKLWDIESSEVVKTLQLDFTRLLAVHPSNENIIVASETSGFSWSNAYIISFHELKTGKLVHELSDSASTHNHISWSPDGTKFATSVICIVIHDSSSWEQLMTLEGHEEDTLTFSWSADSSKLASGSDDCSMKIWDISSGGKVLHTFKLPDIPFRCVAWNHSTGKTNLIASGHSTDYAVRIWDTKSKKMLKAMTGHLDVVRSVCWNRGGTQLVSTGSEDRLIIVWDALQYQMIAKLTGHHDELRSVVWSPFSNQLIASCSKDSTIKLWDGRFNLEKKTGKNGPNGNSHDTEPHQKTVDWVSWHPDGTKLATASEDGTMKVWDLSVSMDKLLFTAEAGSFQQNDQDKDDPTLPRNAVFGVEWDPAGKRIAASSTALVSIWDLDSQKEVRRFTNIRYQVKKIAWNPQGTQLLGVSGVFDRILWEVDSGRVLWQHDQSGKFMFSIQWSRDGAFIATDSSASIQIIEARTGKVVQLLTAESPYYLFALAWSPDNSQLAAAGEHNAIYIYDTNLLGAAAPPRPSEYPKPVKVLEGHSEVITALSWSKTNNKLASGARDCLIKIWETISWTLLRTIAAHQGTINCLAWNPNATILCSTSSDLSVKLWTTILSIDPAEKKDTEARTGIEL